MTNFDRVTKNKRSLMNFVMCEILDVDGPHMDHSIENFANQLKFSKWLDSKCEGIDSDYCSYCLGIYSSTPASPKRKYKYCPMCGTKLDFNTKRNSKNE